MTFDPKDWQSLPAQVTPLSGPALVDLEERLAAYTDAIAAGGVELGYAEITSNATDATAYPNGGAVSGLSITVDVGVRPIIVEFGCYVLSNTSTGSALVTIQEGSTILQTGQNLIGTANKGAPCKIRARLTPSAGSHTYKVHLHQTSAGTATLGATATAPAWIQALEI